MKIEQKEDALPDQLREAGYEVISKPRTTGETVIMKAVKPTDYPWREAA